MFYYEYIQTEFILDELQVMEFKTFWWSWVWILSFRGHNLTFLCIPNKLRVCTHTWNKRLSHKKNPEKHLVKHKVSENYTLVYSSRYSLLLNDKSEIWSQNKTLVSTVLPVLFTVTFTLYLHWHLLTNSPLDKLW